MSKHTTAPVELSDYSATAHFQIDTDWSWDERGEVASVCAYLTCVKIGDLELSKSQAVKAFGAQAVADMEREAEDRFDAYTDAADELADLRDERNAA